MRVRERDRGRQVAGFAHPLEAGQFAVPVQPVCAGEAWEVRGNDDRDARANRVALDERRVPDAHPRDVRDRVDRPRLEVADHDPEVARSHAAILFG